MENKNYYRFQGYAHPYMNEIVSNPQVTTAVHTTDEDGKVKCYWERRTVFAPNYKQFYNVDVCMEHLHDGEAYFPTKEDMMVFLNDARQASQKEKGLSVNSLEDVLPAEVLDKLIEASKTTLGDDREFYGAHLFKIAFNNLGVKAN